MIAAAWRGDHPRRLDEAARRMAHRGPDGTGFLVWPAATDGLRPEATAAALRRHEGAGPTIGFAFRRLAIIDLSPAAGQPMVSSDGLLAVVLNGEIYNYRELRAELERAGRRFRTASDTEVLLEGFAAWGPAVLPRLIGMFAFALLDVQRRRLLLARDPFGIKPLFIARDGRDLAFASEPGALAALTTAPPLARPQAIADFLCLDDDDGGPATIIEGVERLTPGHVLDASLEDPRSASSTAFWRPASATPSAMPLAVSALELRERFLHDVRLHLRSDVPLGFALSGGLDSSSIIGAARAALGAGVTLRAFTFAPDDAGLSELPFARQAASAAGAELYPVTIRPEELAADWTAVARQQGEPFHGPAVYAQHRVFRHAADHGVKVLLEGQGGDELLGGYDRFLTARAASLLRDGRLAEARTIVATLRGHPARHLLAAAAAAWAPLGAMARRSAGWRRRRVAGVGLSAPWLARHEVRQGRDAAPPRPGASPLRAAQLRAIWGNPLQNLLRFGDRNAMAVSLENRVPFLTPRLLDYVLALPDDHLVAGDGTRKAVLREAVKGWVPAPILARRDRVGFATPVVPWLIALKPWVERMLDALGDQPLVDRRRVVAHWQAVQATRDQGAALQAWRWLSLQGWIEAHAIQVPR